jgi:hypothetical protein
MALRKTNQQTLKDIMDFSHYGVLAEIFVMDALIKAVRRVSEATPEDLKGMEGTFIPPEAWQGVAREIKDKLDALYDN